MTDTTTQRPIRVATSDVSAPYIRVPVALLEKVLEILVENDIPHWVDHYVISVNDGPATTVIHLKRTADPRRVQELLDAA